MRLPTVILEVKFDPPADLNDLTCKRNTLETSSEDICLGPHAQLANKREALKFRSNFSDKNANEGAMRWVRRTENDDSVAVAFLAIFNEDDPAR